MSEETHAAVNQIAQAARCLRGLAHDIPFVYAIPNLTPHRHRQHYKNREQSRVIKNPTTLKHGYFMPLCRMFSGTRIVMASDTGSPSIWAADDTLSYALLSVLVFISYFVAAKAGLAMAFVHGNVSAVWPPSVTSTFAALLLYGWKILPVLTPCQSPRYAHHPHPILDFTRHRHRQYS